jgi:RNA polymerase sigma-70 factor (ECF subfamily)
MDVDVFNTDRSRLFSIAYRMLGSASEAEDVLQDAWIRVSGADAGAIRSPQAFATTVVTRLCLDRLKSSHKTREEYVGPWLPEPVLTSDMESPETMLQRAESLTLAFLVLLETLSPEERAVFLLKDVFDYGHGEIAEMLGTTSDNSRQLLHRAKEKIARGRPRQGGTSESGRALAERFARAFGSGDASELTALLTQDVGFWSDGGGKASAARRPLLGREEVLNFLVGLHRAGVNMGLLASASLQFEDINFEPALVMRIAGRLESIFVLSIDGDRISGIRVMRNPDKLARIDRQLATRH